MNFSFYSKYVIFSCMPIDETIQMAGPLFETHLVGEGARAPYS
jgi:hypothetical protein